MPSGLGSMESSPEPKKQSQLAKVGLCGREIREEAERECGLPFGFQSRSQCRQLKVTGLEPKRQATRHEILCTNLHEARTTCSVSAYCMHLITGPSGTAIRASVHPHPPHGRVGRPSSPCQLMRWMACGRCSLRSRSNMQVLRMLPLVCLSATTALGRPAPPLPVPEKH